MINWSFVQKFSECNNLSFIKINATLYLEPRRVAIAMVIVLASCTYPLLGYLFDFFTLFMNIIYIFIYFKNILSRDEQLFFKNILVLCEGSNDKLFNWCSRKNVKTIIYIIYRLMKMASRKIKYNILLKYHWHR